MGWLPDWYMAMEGFRFLRKHRVGKEERGAVLAVREQLKCIELCLGMDEESTENLWVRFKMRTGKVDIVTLCYKLSDQEDQVVRSSTDR